MSGLIVWFLHKCVCVRARACMHVLLVAGLWCRGATAGTKYFHFAQIGLLHTLSMYSVERLLASSSTCPFLVDVTCHHLPLPLPHASADVFAHVDIFAHMPQWLTMSRESANPWDRNTLEVPFGLWLGHTNSRLQQRAACHAMPCGR